MVSSGGGEVGAAKLTGEVLDVVARLPQVQFFWDFSKWNIENFELCFSKLLILGGREHDGRELERSPGEEVDIVSNERKITLEIGLESLYQLGDQKTLQKAKLPSFQYCSTTFPKHVAKLIFTKNSHDFSIPKMHFFLTFLFVFLYILTVV